MENLEEIVSKINIDDVISLSIDESFKNNYKRKVSNQFDELYRKIDRELKENINLNVAINTLVELKKILNYDVRNHFQVEESFYYGGEDVYCGSHFNEDEYNFAINHVNVWPTQKEELLARIQKLENAKLFKGIAKSKIEKIKAEIETGDKRYKKYSSIFNEAEQINKKDKPAVEKDYREKSQAVKSAITRIIDKNILEAIKKDPTIITYDVFVGKNYSTISSSENSTDFNKNIYRFFDSSEINKRLSEILKAYNKIKKQGLEQKAPEQAEEIELGK